MTSAPATIRLGTGQSHALSLSKHRWETIFLFGAGASLGCGEVIPHRPPSGGQLYDRLRAAFPDSWGTLPSGLAAKFAERFEKGMDVLWKEYGDESSLLLQKMGVYFSSFAPAPGKETLYRRIVRRLVADQTPGVLLSTLNYDCLLDGEISLAGLNVNYLFPPDGNMPLLKLHGSCNWFIEAKVGRHTNFSSDIRWEAQIRCVSSAAAVKDHFTGDTSLFPVICLYTEDKPAPLCPSFFQHLHKEWTEQVLSAKQIAIVGVRPYPSDGHIWNPLTKTKARLLCIGNRGAFSEWQTGSGRIGETQVVAERFDEGLDALWEALAL
jgi:hypothetical protein